MDVTEPRADTRPERSEVSYLAGSFVAASLLGALIWARGNGPVRWSIEGRDLLVPGASGAFPVVFGAMGLLLALLLLARAHVGRGESWAACFGGGASLCVWFAGASGGGVRGDDARLFVTLAGALAILLTVVAAGLAALLARHWTPECRRRRHRLSIVMALLGLTVLDASVALDMLGDPSDWSWWYPRCAAASAAVLLVSGLAVGDRSRRVETAFGVLAIALWSCLLPFVPWNHDKRDAIDLRALDGAPLALVRERLADHLCWVRVDVEEQSRTGLKYRVTHSSENVLPAGLLRDLDLEDVRFDYLEFPAFGGVHIAFEAGLAQVGVNFD